MSVSPLDDVKENKTGSLRVMNRASELIREEDEGVRGCMVDW